MNEQLSAEQVRDLLHEVAGLLGIEVATVEGAQDDPRYSWMKVTQRDIDAINEGRVVDAMTKKGERLFLEKTMVSEWRARFGFHEGKRMQWADSRLVAVLLAARAALKAEEAR